MLPGHARLQAPKVIARIRPATRPDTLALTHWWRTGTAAFSEPPGGDGPRVRVRPPNSRLSRQLSLSACRHIPAYRSLQNVVNRTPRLVLRCSPVRIGHTQSPLPIPVTHPVTYPAVPSLERAHDPSSTLDRILEMMRRLTVTYVHRWIPLGLAPTRLHAVAVSATQLHAYGVHPSGTAFALTTFASGQQGTVGLYFAVHDA